MARFASRVHVSKTLMTIGHLFFCNSKNACIRINSVHCFIDIMQFELNKLFQAKYYNL